MRALGLDKPLVLVSLALVAFGLLALFSAGQTDVPTSVATIWQKQLIWFVVGTVAAGLVFRVSPRILEWATPGVYGAAIFLLFVTLLFGTGSGTAAGSKSWLAIAGLRIGQPAELAKLALILILARHLSALREPPANLRDLLIPCALAGAPFLLVGLQPDLGSALVLVAILFVMLYWAGVKPWLLVLLASPAVSLICAFNTWAWGAWIVALFALLLWWRPYVWDGLAVMLVNVAMGVLALPVWQSLAPYQQNRLLAFLNPEVDPRATGWHIIQSKVAIGSGGLLGKGFTLGSQKRLAFLPAQHTDFIFPVVGEELGFLGVLVALALFVTLLLVLIRIAQRALDPFASLIV
ncbi:MAG: rod shape-determining protein RodA, partial [Gemmatimonadales bacterium]